MATEAVSYEVAAETRVATVTMDRPDQRNALGQEMLAGLAAAFARAAADEAVGAIVLTGNGPSFCAGGDLRGWTEGTLPERQDRAYAFAELFVQMTRLGKPVVAAVNGHALGGGLGLVCACDLAVAAETATFGTPEIRVGVWPAMITALVTRTIARKHALELMLLGDRLDAARAAEIGLVNRVVAHGDLAAAAGDWAARCAANSPLLLRIGRDAFYAAQDMTFGQALDHLHGQLARILSTEDVGEGVASFFEKRPPRWAGR